MMLASPLGLGQAAALRRPTRRPLGAASSQIGLPTRMRTPVRGRSLNRSRSAVLTRSKVRRWRILEPRADSNCSLLIRHTHLANLFLACFPACPQLQVETQERRSSSPEPSRGEGQSRALSTRLPSLGFASVPEMCAFQLRAPLEFARPARTRLRCARFWKSSSANFPYPAHTSAPSHARAIISSALRFLRRNVCGVPTVSPECSADAIGPTLVKLFCLDASSLSRWGWLACTQGERVAVIDEHHEPKTTLTFAQLEEVASTYAGQIVSKEAPVSHRISPIPGAMRHLLYTSPAARRSRPGVAPYASTVLP